MATAILYDHGINNMAAFEDLHRDKMLFLDLTSNFNATASKRNYADNIIRNEFVQGVQNKGVSLKGNKSFATNHKQFLNGTQFACAKTTTNCLLASSTCSGNESFGEGNGSQ